MTVENNAMSPMQRADFQPRFLSAAAALLIVPWCCLVSAAQQTEAETAYIQRFEERFPPVAIVPDLESYATPNRYDELYLGTNLDQALEDVQNDQGALAWGLSYRMLSLNTMYRVTRRPIYLEANKRCVLAAANATDDKRGKILWTGAVAPVWGCELYSGRGRAAFAVHTGIIAWPMLEFVRLADGIDGLLSESERTEIVRTVMRALAYHDPQWRDGPGEGEGHYIGKDQEPVCEDRPLPGNRLSAMGLALWESWLLDEHETHRDRARALGRYFQNRLAVGTDGAYYWSYWLPESRVVGTVNRLEIQGEDLSHGGLTVQLAFTLAAANEVFEREDLARFARTATEGFARLKGGVLLGSVNGDPASNPAYVGGATAWLALADSHPEVGRSIVEHYVRYVPTPPPLELARLIEHRAIEARGRNVDDTQPATGRRETE
jgi:hypothetical protein